MARGGGKTGRLKGPVCVCAFVKRRREAGSSFAAQLRASEGERRRFKHIDITFKLNHKVL